MARICVVLQRCAIHLPLHPPPVPHQSRSGPVPVRSLINTPVCEPRESLGAFIKKRHAVKPDTLQLKLQTVPCLNGFLVPGDEVKYRGQEYKIMDLLYVFKHEASMAVMEPLDDEEAIDDLTTITVRSIKLSLVNYSKKHRMKKLLPRPHDADVASQIFWAYSTVKFMLVHAMPNQDRQVYGQTTGIVVGDQNEAFRYAFGMTPGHSRVEYAAQPVSREMANKAWDCLLGNEWDKIRVNIVAYKVAFSLVGSICSAAKQIKMSVYMCQRNEFQSHRDYRSVTSKFVKKTKEEPGRIEDNRGYYYSDYEEDD
jgi:hypothetical protein